MHELMQKVIKEVGFTSTDSKSITGTTSGGICITLHNKGERPTRYTVEPHAEWRKDSTFGKSYPIYRYTLDTIINKDKERHEMIKVNYGWLHIDDSKLSRVASDIRRLLEQDCDGTREDTEKNFLSVGMLFMTKKEA